MKLITNKGFSFVEIIVVIIIIAILGVVATTTSNTFTNNTKNSKVTADISTIENSLIQYVTENKTLPMPKGNNKFYNEDTSYSHGIEDTPFAVSGFITESTLPKKYMNYTPMDPRTNQYYGYARTLIDSNVMRFEVAGVNSNNGVYESVVRGTYTGENGPYSLVKEYNGNDFVFDKSKNHFAYNPEEKVLVGKIDDFTGIARIDSKELGIITEINDILEHNLVPGDTIIVEKDGTANIVFSDGSQVMLGSTEENTELAIADMEFKEENNLFTDIKLVLNIGSAFTQAAKLDSKSNFEVYTSDTVAAVRGTVFGVRKSLTDGTNVVVQQGAVRVDENISNSTDLLDDVSNDNIEKSPVNVSGVTDAYSTIRVNTGSGTIGLVKSGSSFATSGTGILDNIGVETTKRIVDNVGVINNSDQIIVESLEKDGVNRIIKLDLKKKRKKIGTFLFIDNGEKKFFLKNEKSDDGTNPWKNFSQLEIKGDTIFNEKSDPMSTQDFGSIIYGKKNLKVKFCRKRINKGFKCTKEKEINLNLEFNRSNLINNQVSKSEQLNLLKEKKKNIDTSLIVSGGNVNYLPGLKTNYFKNNSLNYSNTVGTPFMEDISTSINNSWGTEKIYSSEGDYIDFDYVAIRYTGYFKATSATHNFRLWGDDGIDFTFNGVNYGNDTYYKDGIQKIANGIHAAGADNSSNGTFITINNLVVGNYYPIDIKYYENYGDASFRMYDNGVISEGNFYHLDKCLTASSLTKNATFTLEDCNNKPEQKFSGLSTSTYNRITSVDNTNIYLDVRGSNFNGGDLIFWNNYHNGHNQQFKLYDDKLKAMDGSGTEYCLGVNGGNIKSGSCSSVTEWELDGDYIKLKD